MRKTSRRVPADVYAIISHPLFYLPPIFLLSSLFILRIRRALGWARKYGLRVNLDLHTAPGSQSGWNHSGRLGSIGWLRGVMGLTNVQRSLNQIRTLTEFISQDQYKNVVPMFSILNEPSSTAVGASNLRQL